MNVSNTKKGANSEAAEKRNDEHPDNTKSQIEENTERLSESIVEENVLNEATSSQSQPSLEITLRLDTMKNLNTSRVIIELGNTAINQEIQINELQNVIDKLRAEIVVYKKLALDATNSRSELAETITKAAAEKENLEKEISDLKLQNSSLLSSNQKWAADMKTKQTAFETYRYRSALMMHNNMELGRLITSEKEAKLLEKEAELTEVKNEKEQLKKNMLRLERQLENIMKLVSPETKAQQPQPSPSRAHMDSMVADFSSDGSSEELTNTDCEKEAELTEVMNEKEQLKKNMLRLERQVENIMKLVSPETKAQQPQPSPSRAHMDSMVADFSSDGSSEELTNTDCQPQPTMSDLRNSMLVSLSREHNLQEEDTNINHREENRRAMFLGAANNPPTKSKRRRRH